MREIKFRAIGVKSGVFEYGFYTHSVCNTSCQIKTVADIPPCTSEPGGGVYSENFDINPKTLGQYTGLKDKNCKEIYEGNIVLYDDKHRGKKVIVFDGGSFKTKSLEDGDLCTFNMRYIGEYEVIGNIHETPELFELLG